jgi:hypothetical protein
MKIIIIVGGGVSMNRMMALVGNLVSQGAGSNEMRDNAIASMGFGRAISGGLGVMKMPFSATRSAFNFTRDARNFGLGTATGRALGFKTARDYKMEQGQLNLNKLGGSGSANNQAGRGSAQLNNGKQQQVKNAINGGGNNFGGNNNNNAGGGNYNRDANYKNLFGVEPPGKNIVNNSVDNALRNNNKKK